MSIPVTCQCGKRFDVPEAYAGKKGKCPACERILTAPAAHDAVSASPGETRAVGKTVPPASLGSPDERRPTRGRRTAWIWIAGAISLLAVIGGLFCLLLRGRYVGIPVRDLAVTECLSYQVVSGVFQWDGPSGDLRSSLMRTKYFYPSGNNEKLFVISFTMDTAEFVGQSKDAQGPLLFDVGLDDFQLALSKKTYRTPMGVQLDVIIALWGDGSTLTRTGCVEYKDPGRRISYTAAATDTLGFKVIFSASEDEWAADLGLQIHGRTPFPLPPPKKRATREAPR